MNMDSFRARVISTTLALFFLIAVGFKTLFPGNDPYRCRAIQSTGRWIDPPDEAGNRYPFHQWQPNGCIMNKYESEDIRRCMQGRRITTVGDSTSRNVGHAFGRLLDRNRSHRDRKQGKMPQAQSFNMTYYGQMIQRLPNIWLASKDTAGQEEFVHNFETYVNEKQYTPSVEKQEGPGLIYLAGGVWFSRMNLTDSARNTTAVATNATSATKNPFTLKMFNSPWTRRFSAYKEHLSMISEFIDANTPNVDPFTAPMDPIDGLGNQIFYAPPAGPVYLGDVPRRILHSSRQADEVVQMRGWLHGVGEDWKLPIVWSIPMLTYGQNKTWLDPYKSGLHVKHQIADTRANILLNLRCNAKLDRMKSYPYKRTCCTDYGIKPLAQLGVVAFCIIYLAACLTGEMLGLYNVRGEPQWRFFNMRAGSFVLALLMCYYADRTQMMAKGAKLWNPIDFVVLCALCVAILLLTVRRSQPLIPMEISLSTKETNESFLSRQQTDEWKGWMQALILIYHWTGAIEGSKSIYILISLCVAAYLFQTGYGHTLYFLRKNDFSFRRVAAVLLRLNLLSCSLAYVMDTDYMFYYFSPLASFWFLVVYATMAIGGKRCNNDSQVVLAKICISSLLVSAIFMGTPFTRFVFDLLGTVFNIQWSYKEWQYRVTLDIFIVYVGMLSAVVNNEMKKTLAHLGPRILLAVTGLLATMYYFHATLHLRLKVYKAWHPLVSFIPILAFVVLRNISAPIRNYHSRVMAWLGRCSLETYILQYHLLMAADAEGVLIVDGFFGDGTVLGDRWRTLVIIVPLFLWVSNSVAKSTAYIVDLIMDTSEEEEKTSRSSFAWQYKVPAFERITAPKVRVACILLVMWILNMMTPGHAEIPAPSGGHHVTVGPRQQ
ncbi:hypothetical protein FSPOR_8921 [Fusarium sporotrichioides]|uniref:Cas1p 10 TM acyl transferase domain-containing protein n=1 Tax=Fusarium sporotrichioides TaxID=5514 RepID=A0A395RS74_FUSSP|nr:hypothetical protein FSPOR_8921 [Fusarium sporotrichioides]